MPPPQQQQQPKQGMTLDEKFLTLVALGQIVSKILLVFLRVPGSAGSRFFSGQAMISLFVGFLWIACKEPVLAVYFFWAVVGMLALHRIAARWVRTPGEHSLYTGLPWLTWLLGVNEITAKGPCEFVLVLISGTVIWGAGHVGLGSWMVVSAFGLAVANAFMTMRDNAMDRARADMLAEQRIVMRRWQEQVNPAPARRGRSRLGIVAVLALGGGAAWLIHNGTVTLPGSLRGLLPAMAQPSEEEQMRLRIEEDNRRMLQAINAAAAREHAQRMRWRAWNQGYGY
jgi:hypothetical protein